MSKSQAPSFELDVLGIGAGPANLAMAVALEELAPDDFARQCLLVERSADIAWQRGMLLPWARSQVSFLKDLVTMRNPRSRFTFVNYLHSTGRLNEFVNMGSFTPFRSEISGYLEWVAYGLEKVSLEFNRTCERIIPVWNRDGSVDLWEAQFADGTSVLARDIVLGVGRDPRIPVAFADLPSHLYTHSTQFATRVRQLVPRPEHVVVVGSAQSAAEMLWTVMQMYPATACTMVMRTIGLNNYESSKFTNELFYPGFVDEFFGCDKEAQSQLLAEMHRTNYSGLAPHMLETLYEARYLGEIRGDQRMSMHTMSDVVSATVVDDKVCLRLRSRANREESELVCDHVFLGTGFDPAMPGLVRSLQEELVQDVMNVSRSYRAQLPAEIRARCYLQGVNEATHGIADSLLSVLANRSGEIVIDILEHRQLDTTGISRMPAGANEGIAV